MAATPSLLQQDFSLLPIEILPVCFELLTARELVKLVGFVKKPIVVEAAAIVLTNRAAWYGLLSPSGLTEMRTTMREAVNALSLDKLLVARQKSSFPAASLFSLSIPKPCSPFRPLFSMAESLYAIEKLKEHPDNVKLFTKHLAEKSAMDRLRGHVLLMILGLEQSDVRAEPGMEYEEILDNDERLARQVDSIKATMAQHQKRCKDALEEVQQFDWAEDQEKYSADVADQLPRLWALATQLIAVMDTRNKEYGKAQNQNAKLIQARKREIDNLKVYIRESLFEMQIYLRMEEIVSPFAALLSSEQMEVREKRLKDHQLRSEQTREVRSRTAMKNRVLYHFGITSPIFLALMLAAFDIVPYEKGNQSPWSYIKLSIIVTGLLLLWGIMLTRVLPRLACYYSKQERLLSWIPRVEPDNGNDAAQALLLNGDGGEAGNVPGYGAVVSGHDAREQPEEALSLKFPDWPTSEAGQEVLDCVEACDLSGILECWIKANPTFVGIADSSTRINGGRVPADVSLSASLLNSAIVGGNQDGVGMNDDNDDGAGIGIGIGIGFGA